MPVLTPNLLVLCCHSWLRHRFPAIYKHCMDRGLDMTREPLPVVPAAHYFCGGVATDLNGQTTVPGLYAAGEVSYLPWFHLLIRLVNA